MGRMTSHISWKIKNVWNHQPEKGKLHDVHYSFKSLIIFPACCLKFCIYIYTHLMFPLREAKLGEFPLPFLLRRTCEQSDASPLKQVTFLPCFGGWINPHGDCRFHGSCELALTCTDCWRFIYDSWHVFSYFILDVHILGFCMVENVGQLILDTFIIIYLWASMLKHFFSVIQ